jgi:hypothetical protein
MPTWLKSRLGKSVAAGTLAVALVGGAAFAVAGPLMSSTVSSTVSTPASAAAVQTASGNTGSSSASQAKPAKGRAGVLRKLLSRSVHATLVVKGKGGTYVTLTLDRGTIQSISSTSITILRPDGVSVTAPISTSTKFLRASESSLASGDKVVVVQESGTTRDVIAIGKGAAAKSGATSSASVGLSTT